MPFVCTLFVAYRVCIDRNTLFMVLVTSGTQNEQHNHLLRFYFMDKLFHLTNMFTVLLSVFLCIYRCLGDDSLNDTTINSTEIPGKSNNNILIAQHEKEVIEISTTSVIISNSETDSILLDDVINNDRKDDIYNAVILLSIGMLCGILISLFVCLLCWLRCRGQTETLQISKKRDTKTLSNIKIQQNIMLSPSLKTLSPRLSPTEPPAKSPENIETMNSLQVEVGGKMGSSGLLYIQFIVC